MLENPTGQSIEETKRHIVTLVNGADAMVSDMHVYPTSSRPSASY